MSIARVAYTAAHAALLVLRDGLLRLPGLDSVTESTVSRSINDALDAIRAAALATGVVTAKGGGDHGR